MNRMTVCLVFLLLTSTISVPAHEFSLEEQALQECGQFLRAQDAANG